MGAYWNDFISGILNYAQGAYSSLDPYTIPVFLCVIAAFMFYLTGSLIIGTVVILIVVSLYGTTLFLPVPDITMLLYIIALISLAALFTMLIIKRRN